MADEQQVSEQAETAWEDLDTNSFASLLQKEFKPKSDRAKDEVEKAVNTLAGYALEDANIISEDTVNSIESIIAEIEELQYLSSFFVDQRKAVAEISIKNLQNKLNAIQIIPIIHNKNI